MNQRGAQLWRVMASRRDYGRGCRPRTGYSGLLEPYHTRWKQVFKTKRGKSERGYVNILSEIRNEWGIRSRLPTIKLMRPPILRAPA